MADADRASGADPDPGTVAVTFHPQEWVDSPGEDHDWDRRQLIPARERDAVTFRVPRTDATDDAGNPYPDESYEANLLADHSSAPEWVHQWDGPYYVTVAED
ncbi:hypothetical protein ABSL23_00420 (plasmid) [Halobacterium sp. NMX12-1]|uniref:Uncharacterized protein n=1 Tax=Halobacterium sp. NMX12-1 TaxID=3166650 RepID=A0AAU8C8A2_9EURY